MKKIILLLVLINFLHGDIFEQGRTALSIKGGLVTVNNSDYAITGANIGWFVLDDLKLGMGYERWYQQTPNLDKLTIDIDYYIPIDNMIRPYIGAFYANNYLGSIDSGTSQGFKLGLLFYSDVASIGLEWNQEYFNKCTLGCERAYPMVVFSFAL